MEAINGVQRVDYMAIHEYDFSQPWRLEGNFTLSWGATTPTGSGVNGQIKAMIGDFISIPAPPAMVAGLAMWACGMMRRQRSARRGV